MSEKLNIKLEQVDLAELPQFTKKMQEAFSIAVKENLAQPTLFPLKKR